MMCLNSSHFNRFCFHFWVCIFLYQVCHMWSSIEIQFGALLGTAHKQWTWKTNSLPWFPISAHLRLLANTKMKKMEAPWLILLPLCIHCHSVEWWSSIPDKTCIPGLQSWGMVDLWVQHWWSSVWLTWIPCTSYSNQRIHWRYINFSSNCAWGCRRHPILKYSCQYSILCNYWSGKKRPNQQT
jgi:hypothetical protein